MNPDYGLPSYPDKFFDLAIVDPPYGIGIANDGLLHHNKQFEKGFRKNIDYGAKRWDSQKPKCDYFFELFRVSKNQIVWGFNFFTEHLPNSRNFIVWYKKGTDSNPNFSPCELAWTSFSFVPKVYFYDWVGFGYINNGEKKIHPCHKPKRLYEKILEDYAKPGQLILDTHVGSASSLIACESMGFDYVGFEIDPDYYAAAKNRMSKGIQAVLM